ncbi:MAG: 4Fe-4S binding protein [Candidatus Micrarchaeota archaeon]
MIPRCPKRAISQDGFGLPEVDGRKCVECLYCINHCPKGAFEKA